NGVAINTKGTGAAKGRTANGGDDSDGDLWPDASVRWGYCNNSPKDDSFVTQATDARGVVITGQYDAKGNRAKGKFPWVPGAEADMAYDAYGEMSSVTNAADANGYRRVDTLTWSQGQLAQCVVDALSHELTHVLQQDTRGNLLRYVDPRTNDWLFTYNA